MIGVLTSYRQLEARLGADVIPIVDAFLRRYMSLQQPRGLEVLVLRVDDPINMAAFGLGPIVFPTAASIRQAVVAIRHALSATVSPLESLLFLGGDEVIPLHRLPNPVVDRRLDPDPVVATDNGYGAIDDSPDEWLAPTLPVGRLCDGGSLESFGRALDGLLTNLEARPHRSGSCAVINEQWVDATAEAVACLEAPVETRVAPHYVVASGNRGDLDRQFVFINLHGFDGDPVWKAYDISADEFVTVITPDSFASSEIAGVVIISGTCYGAQISGRTASDSCVIRAQREGAAVIVGATGLVFGSILMPWLIVDDADKLMSLLVEGIVPGITAGTLFAESRKRFVAACRTLRGQLNSYEQKTALQFILLGDPTIPMS